MDLPVPGPEANTNTNQSFSPLLPTLQTTIDSTSLGEFKTCPRKYYYRVVLGFVPRAASPHLLFGQYVHSALERYDRARANGLSHTDALRAAVLEAMTLSWHGDRPWWSGHPTKNRLTLIRTVVWYLDRFGEDDSLQTLLLASSESPAVELSFQFSVQKLAVTGEPIFFCGHIDKIALFNTEPYIVDRKTTSITLSTSFFSQFSPDNQFSLYTLAGKIAYETPVRGIICDGIQVAATFSRFERQMIPRSEAQIEEWLSDTFMWLDLMGQMAESNRWPMNDKACHHYGGCPYRPVCSRAPSARQTWLEADYIHSIWDPTRIRGDV